MPEYQPTPPPSPSAKMASSLHPLATYQPQCWAAGWHWRAGAPAQGAAVRQSYLGKPRFEAGRGKKLKEIKGGWEPDERNFLLLSHSLPQLSPFTIPSGRANGRWEEPSSLLLHYTRLPSCLGSRHGFADPGEAPASASQPRGMSPRRGTAARSRPSWEPGLFPTQLHDIEETARLRRKHIQTRARVYSNVSQSSRDTVTTGFTGSRQSRVPSR